MTIPDTKQVILTFLEGLLQSVLTVSRRETASSTDINPSLATNEHLVTNRGLCHAANLAIQALAMDKCLTVN